MLLLRRDHRRNRMLLQSSGAALSRGGGIFDRSLCDRLAKDWLLIVGFFTIHFFILSKNCSSSEDIFTDILARFRKNGNKQLQAFVMVVNSFNPIVIKVSTDVPGRESKDRVTENRLLQNSLWCNYLEVSI
jgi:hypothetical protein